MQDCHLIKKNKEKNLPMLSWLHICHWWDLIIDSSCTAQDIFHIQNNKDYPRISSWLARFITAIVRYVHHKFLSREQSLTTVINISVSIVCFWKCLVPRNAIFPLIVEVNFFRWYGGSNILISDAFVSHSATIWIHRDFCHFVAHRNVMPLSYRFVSSIASVPTASEGARWQRGLMFMAIEHATFYKWTKCLM